MIQPLLDFTPEPLPNVILNPTAPIERKDALQRACFRILSRLIAAAPQMLAALRGLADASLCFCGHETEEIPHTRPCDAARTAIAKAEGRKESANGLDQ